MTRSIIYIKQYSIGQPWQYWVKDQELPQVRTLNYTCGMTLVIMNFQVRTFSSLKNSWRFPLRFQRKVCEYKRCLMGSEISKHFQQDNKLQNYNADQWKRLTVFTTYQEKFQETRKTTQESYYMVNTKVIGVIVVQLWGTNIRQNCVLVSGSDSQAVMFTRFC